MAAVNELDGVAADPSVRHSLDRAATALEGAGYVVEEATPPHFGEAGDLWSPLVLNEMRVSALADMQARGGAEVRNALAAWLEITPPRDLAGFSQGLGRREQILRDWIAFLQTDPIIVTPCSWKAPFPLGLDQHGPAAMREIVAAQGPLLTVALLGLPAITVPTGLVDGLPTGVQIVADRFREDLCFGAGEAIERAFGTPTPIDPRA